MGVDMTKPINECSPEQDALASALMIVIAELKEHDRDRAEKVCRLLVDGFDEECWGPEVVAYLAHQAFCPKNEPLFDEAAKLARQSLEDVVCFRDDATETFHQVLGASSILTGMIENRTSGKRAPTDPLRIVEGGAPTEGAP